MIAEHSKNNKMTNERKENKFLGPPTWKTETSYDWKVDVKLQTQLTKSEKRQQRFVIYNI